MSKDNPLIGWLKKTGILAEKKKPAETAAQDPAPEHDDGEEAEEPEEFSSPASYDEHRLGEETGGGEEKESSPAEKKNGTLRLTFAELSDIIRRENFDFEKLVPQGEELVYFDKIFEIANVRSLKNNWSILRVIERLDSEEFRSIGRENIIKSLNNAFRCDKISYRDILKDGLKRDKAIDAYEKFMISRIKNRRISLLKKNDAMRRRLILNEEIMDNDRAFLRQWKHDKVALEENMAKVFSLFTEEEGINVTSVDELAAIKEELDSIDIAGEPEDYEDI